MDLSHSEVFRSFFRKCWDEDLIGKALKRMRLDRINPNGTNTTCNSK